MKNSWLLVTVYKLGSTTFKRSFLSAGEGSNLKTFSKTGQLLCTVEALPFKVVHGIKPLLHSELASVQSWISKKWLILVDNAAALLLVFGQKSFRVVEILKGGGAGLQYICDVSELADWILDASWLAWKDSDNHQLVFITAHNVLVCRTAVEGMLTTVHYHSEISCILYPHSHL